MDNITLISSSRPKIHSVDNTQEAPNQKPVRFWPRSLFTDFVKQPFWRVLLSVMIGSILLNSFFVLFGFAGTGDDGRVDWQEFVYGVVIAMSMWLSMGFLNSTLSSRLPWLAKPWVAFGIALLSNVVVATLALGIVHFSFAMLIHGGSPLDWLARQRFGNYVGSILIGLFITAVYQGAYFVGLWKSSFKEAETLKSANLTAQFEVLTAQVNPHFLFNSLNVLSALVRRDPAAAEDFIQGLSEVYRYVLEVRGETLVPLSRELQALNAYAKLVTVRFGAERCRIDLQLSPEDNRSVVPLALQMLVENAVKHNGATRSIPLVIEVFAKADWLVVRNNRVPTFEAPDGAGIGLDNIAERYRLATGRAIQVLENSTHFTVNLPL